MRVLIRLSSVAVVLVITLLISLLASTAPPSASALSPYLLEGHVRDASRPIGGAIVAASGPVGWAVQTDRSGFYAVRLPVGTYNVTVTQRGYLSRSLRVRAVDEQRQVVDFVLSPDPMIATIAAPVAEDSRGTGGGGGTGGAGARGKAGAGGASGGSGAISSTGRPAVGSGSGAGSTGGATVSSGNGISAGEIRTGSGGSADSGGQVATSASGDVEESSGSRSSFARGTSPTPVGPTGLLTDGFAVLSIPQVTKPPYLSAFIPAPFSTTVTRIVGDPGTPIVFKNGATGIWNTDSRHHYALDQPWNADQSLIAIDQPGGSPDLLFLDGSTYRPRFPRCANYHRLDDRWHPTKPHIRINGGGTVLEWFDVVSCRRVKSWTLPFAVDYLGRSKGNPSLDGKLIVLGDTTRMFVVDMLNNTIGPVADITYGAWVVDHMSISPSGRFAIVHYDGDYHRVFDVDPATLALTPRPMAVTPACHGTAAAGFLYDLGHADMALNPFDHNEDVIIGQEHCGLAGRTVNGQLIGHVLMIRLRDGRVTSLTDPTNEAYAFHISTRNTSRPGWAYVSYFPYEQGMRFDQEIIAVRLDGRKTVERWAHHHADAQGCYRCEVHPVPSPDGLRVLFNSEWNLNCLTRCGTQVVRQAYVVDARPQH